MKNLKLLIHKFHSFGTKTKMLTLFGLAILVIILIDCCW